MIVTVESNQTAETLREQGFEELRQGAYEQAINTFTACLAQAPQASEAFRGRATAEFQLKQWQTALADFKQAHALDPEQLENWIGLGMSLAMNNDIYGAIGTLETLLEKSPNYARGHIQLGLLYYKMCMTAKGREHMEKALASRPVLDERRFIEDILRKEKELDAKRFYRPDFEALRKKKNKQ